jgi:hypothetical protein
MEVSMQSVQDFGYYYAKLNSAFKINFEQKYFLNQATKATNGDEGYRSEFATVKLTEHAEARNLFFKDFEEELDAAQGAIDLGMGFPEIKKMLHMMMNRVFNEKGKFEDFFDDFHILYEPFKKERERLFYDVISYHPSEDMLLLHQIYDEYFVILQYKSAIDSCKQIEEVLKNDFTESGYKSIFYEKPISDNIFKVDSSMVLRLVKTADNLYKECNKTFERENKKFLKEKIGVEQKDTAFISMLEEKRNMAFALKSFSSILKERMSAINSSYYGVKDWVGDLILDVRTKTPLFAFDKKKNWVYMSKSEIDLVKFFLESIKPNEELVGEVFGENCGIIKD